MKKLKSGIVALIAAGLLCMAVSVMAAPNTPENDGVIAAIGAEARFTVVSVNTDPNAHSIVLADKDGKTETLKLGPEVKNFSQIQAGDNVVVVNTAQVALFYDKVGQVPGMGRSEMVFTKPQGSKPGLLVVEQRFVTLQITAVDATNKTITVTLPDNTTKTVTTPNVDFSKVKVGNDVIVLFANERSIVVVASK